VAGRVRSSATASPRGQHYLADRRLAAELVDAAELKAADLVVEVGAGFGRLTDEVARRAGHVVAIEADGRSAARLASRYRSDGTVRVVAGDALRTPLPRRPFKVVANPPFYLTADLLRWLLDDLTVPLERADLVLEWRAAVGLCAVSPPSRRSMGWQPWYEFLLVRRLAASRFSPAPSGDAALVSVRRRSQPLLAPRQADAFRRWLRRQAPGPDVWDLAQRFRTPRR
jgi:23S rRNA (adenine-N6)-dimethyltransferase